MSDSTPDRWRISVEYANFEQAQVARSLLRSTVPAHYRFDALDRDGLPLWHEHGVLHLRPKDVE